MPLILGLDGDGNPVEFYVQGPGPTIDFSGAIAADGVSQPAAVANPNRAYLTFQNRGANVMYVSDVGDAGDPAAEPSSFTVAPGQSWPPPGYPIPLTQINVSGTAGDGYLYREA